MNHDKILASLYNTDAENVVIKHYYTYPEAIEETDLVPNDFMFPKNKDIFEAIYGFQMGRMRDCVSITDAIGMENTVYIQHNLLDIDGDFKKACTILKQKAANRNLLKILQDSKVKLVEKDADQIIDEISSEFTAMQLVSDEKDDVTLAEVSADRINHYQKVRKGEIEPSVPTGLADLDLKTGGFGYGELVVIGASTGHGKTAMALTCAYNQIKKGYKVGIFSVEMQPSKLADRLAAIESVKMGNLDLRNVNLERFASRKASSEEFDLMEKCLYSFMSDSGSKMIFYKGSDYRIEKIAKKIKQWVNEGKADIIYVDYIQLLGAKSERQTREREVANISRTLKELANRYNIPIVALSQLNKEAEVASIPKVSHLRESAAISHDANKVLILRRVKATQLDSDKSISDTELYIAKNRDGAMGLVNIHFDPTVAQFTDFEKYRNEPDDFYKPTEPLF